MAITPSTPAAKSKGLAWARKQSKTKGRPVPAEASISRRGRHLSKKKKLAYTTATPASRAKTT